MCKCFMPDWTLIIAQKSTVVKIDVLCSDILTDRLLGRTCSLIIRLMPKGINILSLYCFSPHYKVLKPRN